MPGKHPPKDRRHYYMVPRELGERLDRIAEVCGRNPKSLANDMLDEQLKLAEWTHRKALRALPLAPHRWWCPSVFRGHLCDVILGAGARVMSRAHRWHFEESPAGIVKWHDDDAVMDRGDRVPAGLYDRLRDKIANAGRGRALIDLLALIEVETVLPDIVIADFCRVIGIAEDRAALEAWSTARERLEVLRVVRVAMAIAEGRTEEDLEPDEDEVPAAQASAVERAETPIAAPAAPIPAAAPTGSPVPRPPWRR